MRFTEREGRMRDVIVYARIRNATRVDCRKIKFSDREGHKGGKGDRGWQGGSLDAKASERLQGRRRASERGAGGGMPDAVGDNCRRASLLRCSCKEVLRRDKAPAITIEPRGNSLPTCHTHTHAHTCARARSSRSRSSDVFNAVRDLRSARIFFASARTGARVCA